MRLKDSGRRAEDVVFLQREILISTVKTLGRHILFPSSSFTHPLPLLLPHLHILHPRLWLQRFVNLSFLVWCHFIVTEKDPPS